MIAGMIGGGLLPFIARAMASPQSAELVARLDDGWSAVVAYAAYGALAGWAIGALVSHLLRER